METPEQFISRKRQEFAHSKKLIVTKDIARQGSNLWKRRGWTFMPQSDHPEKVFVFERWEWVGQRGSISIQRQVGKVEYRLGYFIIAKNGKAAGRWTWGQYCPLIPAQDFGTLLSLARADGTLLADLTPN